jgi:hypothetical protein
VDASESDFTSFVSALLLQEARTAMAMAARIVCFIVFYFGLKV